MAFERGEQTDQAMVGALIRAGEARDLRDLGALARGLGKKRGGR